MTGKLSAHQWQILKAFFHIISTIEPGLRLSKIYLNIQTGSRYFCESFYGHPCPTSSKKYATAMPTAAPAVLLLSLITQQGVLNIVLAMTRRDFVKPAFSLRKKPLRENTCTIASGDQCVMKKGESLSCCIKDERRPLSFGDQKSELNHPMRLLLRAMVVSDQGKGSL